MNNTIVLVENNPNDAIRIQTMLNEAHLECIAQFKTVKAAVNYCLQNPPDLIICDIFLDGKETGIDLLNQLRDLPICIILITNSIDEKLYETAKKIRPVNYLLKPLRKLCLISTVEKLLSEQSESYVNEQYRQPCIFVRDAHNRYERVNYTDILYFETDANYTFIFTVGKKYVIKKSLVSILFDLDNRFIRCHNKYAINKQHISSISNDTITIGDKKINLGRAYRDKFSDLIKELAFSAFIINNLTH